VQYRPLGSSGLRVSEIGFGSWGIGGLTPGPTSYGRTEDAVSRRALQEALDRGINFFDTSSVYGDGHSEELLGEALTGRRDQVVIATKGGIQPAYRGYDFSADALRTSLEGSLRRLRTDYVDLFQLHNAGADVVGSLSHLSDLLSAFRREGKIRAFGFSTPTPEDALALLDFPGAVSFQVNCNLLDWRAIDCGLLERAGQRGIGIVARTPLAFGFLSGRLAADVVFEPSDHRSRWSRDKIVAWVEAANNLFGALGTGPSVADHVAVAMRFCLSFPAVVTVIPGMLTAEEVRSNAAASAQGPLGAEDISRVREVYRRHEARLRA
jgi:aryl-alcohol dehydrogenase-like predicted oxidoreductase